MLDRELDIAKRLAREAGAVILGHYADAPAVEFKGGGTSDPVTQADRDANRLIVDGLAAAFPEDAVLAEESPLSPGRHDHRRLWCIDPLDGTQEFIAHNGQFSVMIGLAVDGEARLGVVYQPTEDVLTWGAGGAAWSQRRDGVRQLACTRTSEPSLAVMMVSRSHLSKSVTQVGRVLAVARQEPLGSVGLKVVRIAEGTADLYVSLSTKTSEWDACAPEAILRAAGGLMTDSLGEPLRYNKASPETPRGLVASNGALHAAVLQAVRPLAKERVWV